MKDKIETENKHENNIENENEDDNKENNNLKNISNNNLNTSTGKNSEQYRKEDPLSIIMDNIGMSNYQFKLILFGILISFSYGSEIVVVSLITRKLEKIWHLSDMKKAFLGGSLFYGFLLSSLISGDIMNSKGRRFCLNFGCWLFLIFGILSSSSYDFYSFMFYRIGVGFSLGLMIPAIITFISEMSPSNYRGFCMNLIWFGFPLGELYICLIAKMFPLDNKFSQDRNWTNCLIFAAIPVILNILILQFIGESPKLLFMQQQFTLGFTELNKIITVDFRPLIESEKVSIINHYAYETDKEKKQNEDVEEDKNIKLKEAHSLKNKALKHYNDYSKLINENIDEKKIIFLNLFSKKYFKTTIQMIVLTYAISYLFFGLLYIIPEVYGKKQEYVSFHDLLRTVVVATVFEFCGIIFSFMMEIPFIGRLGTFKYSLFICVISSTLSLTSDKNPIFLFVLKGVIGVSNRVLFTYFPESYSSDVRGTALGFAQALTKIIGITSPIICQFLLGFSSFACLSSLTLFSIFGFLTTLTMTNETLNKKIN